MNRINNSKINQYRSLEAVRKTDVKGAGKTSDAAEVRIAKPKLDQVSLSGQASEVGQLVDRLKDLPDIREAKVAALREKVQTGEYRPSGEEIAGAILKDEK